jgi:predicted amidohydrolase YtcJ
MVLHECLFHGSRLFLALSIGVLALAASLQAQKPAAADLVFYNGKVWTVDDQMPQAEALAVRDGRILLIGKNGAVKALIGPATRAIDLKGRVVMPGFIDNHVHFLSSGLQLLGIELRSAKSEAEFARRIQIHAEKYPGRWITGGDWDHESWPGAREPHRGLIDAVTPNTPVFVNRLDGHMALANSVALKLAGIDRNTPDPPGGEIVRDPETGEPTGLLKDEAMTPVYAVIPAASESERIEGAKAALDLARRCGITSIQDVSSAADLRIYQTLLERDELTLRLDCRLPISQYESLADVGIRAHFGGDMLRIGSLKAFADGSLGSTTALFFEPYEGSTSRGLPMDIVLDGRLEKWALAADKERLQLSVHAIGDSANSLMLDIFERCVRENPAWDRRFRIEHAQHIAKKDLARFAELGVIASAQPYHAIDDGRWAHKRIGEARCHEAYPFRSFLDQGVHLCFGTDWSVAPLNPLWGIYAAVTRRTLDGRHPEGWIPEEKISVAEAVACYTRNSAYASYDEDVKGQLIKGYFADLVVLSEDIFALPPEKIWDVQVDLTVLAGRVIYERAPGETIPAK